MRKLMASVLAASFLVVLAPVANAGPGGAICRATSNVYQTATGKEAPWNCTY